jgi:hypothetical protein
LTSVVRQVLEDAERVRASALKDDPEAPGGKAVVNGDLLLKANRRQLEVVSAALRLQREVNEVREQGQFYAGLLRILESELAHDPNLLRRVTARLADLHHSQTGTLFEVI